jgi:high-affinity Fe2+/Pb2+ permease
VIFATAAVALLTAPAAWHRMLFRLGRRETVVNVAQQFAMYGLGCLAVAMTGTVLLLGEMIVGGWPAIVLAALAAIGLVLVWFALPIRYRRLGPTPERMAS